MITTTIVYWPDGSWCRFNAMPQFAHLDEGYKFVYVPVTSTEEQIGALVQMLVTKGE